MRRAPATRAEMYEALQRLVVPELRKLGFRGSKPYFRRQRGDYWDLLSFQFSVYGGKFVVELGRFPIGGIRHSSGKLVPPEKVKNNHIAYRQRLGAPEILHDHWFDFKNASPEDVASDVLNRLADPHLWEMVDTLPVAGDRKAMKAFSAALCEMGQRIPFVPGLC